jgi:hypothetical protein
MAFSRRQDLKPDHVELNDVVAGQEGVIRALIGANVELVINLGSPAGIVYADLTQIQQVRAHIFEPLFTTRAGKGPTWDCYGHLESVTQTGRHMAGIASLARERHFISCCGAAPERPVLSNGMISGLPEK